MTKLPHATDVDVVVEIPLQFGKYADAAMLRLQVLYPACRIARQDGEISVRSSGCIAEDQFRKDVLHFLYREKIYTETLTMRQALVAAVTTS
ncbi:putative Rhodospirillum photometricum DSM 122 draft genome sequence [Mesorhizobium plurifarium]|uniref:Putative Rhodospirillum photometricum DSM 122 draft genome sequence n=1 Tax=Mesorhizobium plurifarium TaxID=69974 RepID=A0A090DEJ4_MESPL|nr:putative Rhodospirillum photometricum DSM 122 draft genome sequence [Mesorhizobium plurifarium]